MKVAAAYIRVSTDDQVEYSPDSQLKLLREYAKKNDYILPDEYIFQDDGISGKDAEHRPAFNHLIALAKSEDHPIDTILVWKFSRFARNQEQSIVFKNMLRKAKVEVRSISEPVDPDSAFGSLIERIIEWMDEYYLINLSTEVKRGMNERFERGEIVTPPSFGYKVENGIYVPDPEEAPIIKRIYQMYLDGIAISRIARTLGAEGVRTKRGNLPDNRFIQYILENPVYIGMLRWSKDGRASSTRYHNKDAIITQEGKHEPLIDLKTWNAAQEKAAQVKMRYKKYQRQEQSIDFMLKGLVRCSSCGATLCQASKGISIQCHNYNRGQCQVSHHIYLSKINKAVIEGIEQAICTMDFKLAPKSIKVADSTDTDKLIIAEQKKLERVKAAYENGIDTLDEYIENKTKITTTIKNLQASQPQAKSFNKSAYAKKVTSVLKIIKSDATEEEKNQALRTIVDSIIFNRTESTIDITFYV